MAVRTFIQIKTDLHDLWDIRSVESREQYNPIREEMDYMLILNRTAKTKDIENIEYAFEDREQRDNIVKDITRQMDESDIFYIFRSK